jgi:hypothetical protein
VRQISLVKALRSRAIFFESTATLVDARFDGMADDFAVAAECCPAWPRHGVVRDRAWQSKGPRPDGLSKIPMAHIGIAGF